MDQLAHLRWTLERQLHWIGTADLKLTILSPIALALAASLLAGSSMPTGELKSIHFPYFAALLLSGAVVWFCLAAQISRLSGPKGSRIFFGGISEITAEQFIDISKSESGESITADLLAQIHINARIALTKHTAVRRATYCLIVALPFWVIFFVAKTRAGASP